MGLLTLVIIAIVILAVIGLGVGTFYSGIVQGTQKVERNTVVKDMTGGAKEFASNVSKSASN